MEYEMIEKKGKDFEIVYNSFVHAIKTHLGEGWKLQGGIATITNPVTGEVVFAQTLTR